MIDKMWALDTEQRKMEMETLFYFKKYVFLFIEKPITRGALYRELQFVRK